MIINRIWAMPNHQTFLINPIQRLLEKYVGDGKTWIDPFAGNNSPAQITNDLNPKCKTQYHYEACTFLKRIPEGNGKISGSLFDPPYSIRQIKECYENIRRKFTYEDSIDASFAKAKEMISKRIKLNGYCISFGWNSNGLGKTRGYEIIEILLVAHGGAHNDTIVMVEKRIK